MQLLEILSSASSVATYLQHLFLPAFEIQAAAAGFTLPSNYDEFWSWKPFGEALFRKPIWVDLMFTLRLSLCMIGALLLMWEVRAWRMGSPFAERMKKRIAIGMTLLSFGAYFEFSNPKVRYGEYYHRHEFYHYYLGSKYSEELGYQRLYDCTLIAEVDNGRGSQVKTREFRDLSVNLIKKASDTYIINEPERCKKHFTSKRWEEFRTDVDWFYSSSRGSYWQRMQKDHGYNPPPVWTMGGKFFANMAPAGKDFFKILATIDIVLQGSALALLYWAFGWRAGATAAIFWGCNAAANFYWTGGAFLRMDWIFFLIASICLARKRFFFLAGVALMWCGLLRLFPLALYAGWSLMVLIYALKRILGRPSVDGKTGFLSYIHPSHRRLIAGSVLAIAVLVPASMASTGGIQPYKEFFHHIQTHKKTPLTNHMGVPTILSHTWEGRMRFTKNTNLDDSFEEWKAGRNERKDKFKLLNIAIFCFFIAWLAWALRRTTLVWVGPVLSLPLIMIATDLTCYYYSMYMIAAVLVLQRRGIGVALLATGGASVILLSRSIGYARNGMSGFYFIDDNYAAQSYLFMLFSILMLWNYSRPFSIKALLNWLQGRPDKFKERGNSGT